MSSGLATEDKPTAAENELGVKRYCERDHKETKLPDGTVRYEPYVPAFILAKLPGGGDLAFCGKHYRQNEVALAAAGAEIVDLRKEKINARSESSA